MRMRAPAYPLITVDPYFSVWSRSDTLNGSHTMHWTNHTMKMTGEVIFDGVPYRFMGLNDVSPIPQIKVDVNAYSTFYTFENGKLTLSLRFMTPLTMNNLHRMTRPVSYLKIDAAPKDGKKHEIRVKLSVCDEICLNESGESPVVTEQVSIEGISCMRMGNSVQKPLNRSGDDLRIDWGYFYLCVCGDEASVIADQMDASPALTAFADASALFLFAYDDLASMMYFWKPLKSVWNQSGSTIEQEIYTAARDFKNQLPAYCDQESDRLFCDAVRAGGEKYAEMLLLAYRQAIAAHKCVVDDEGEILFVSKECYSNGCAATVDVSYPSIPLFLLYNTELVKGMMRPIFRYAATDEWKNVPYAPHDCGRYPIMNGQVYGISGDVYGVTVREPTINENMQMPVEECGNMLIMAAAVSVADKNAKFAKQHIEVLTTWAEYLAEYGLDPNNQLCTDDFAGHLAHNCNLSLKAIMGLASFAILNRMWGRKKIAAEYDALARRLAKQWCEMASNGDGSYRLAFDRPGTFSMKYNAVWDKLFGTDIFPKEVIAGEIASNFKHFNPYGMPLDNRSDYTKSDWLVWTATLADTREDFERFIEPLWSAYHHSESRVPMTDWYFTTTAKQRGFQNRTVQGGLFIKLLCHLEKMRLK